MENEREMQVRLGDLERKIEESDNLAEIRSLNLEATELRRELGIGVQ